MSQEERMLEAIKDVAEGKYVFETVEMEFEKKPLEVIIDLAPDIDTDKAANEVLDWLTENVENFIDNKEKEFRIDLVIEDNSGEKMENIKKLQDLYRAVPDDSEFIDADRAEEIMKGNLEEAFEDENFKKLVACREVLDRVSYKVHDKIRASDKLNDLYKAMIYFYEMCGINQGMPLIKDLAGGVDVVEFEYEAFSVGVNVLEGVMKMDQDVNDECKKDVVKQYTIPEGFSLLLEISFIDQSRSIGMF